MDGRDPGDRRTSAPEVGGSPELADTVRPAVDLRSTPHDSTPMSSTAAMRLARPGLRAFFRISELWKLSVDEQIALLGGPARATFFRWRREGADILPRDVLERISHLLGIYRNLQILLPGEEAADRWVRESNTATPFGGGSALERMLAGEVADLHAVRRYLEGVRSGWL